MATEFSVARGKRGVSRGLTKEIILDKTKIVCADRGIENVRILDVAKLCGVQPSAIYNFFDGREGLLTALAESIAREVILYGEPDSGLSPEHKLRFITDQVTRIMYKNELNARMELMDIANKGLIDRGVNRELNEYSRNRLRKVLEEGAALGVFRPVNVDTVRAFFVASVPSRVLWYNYEGSEQHSLSQIQDEVYELIHHYVAARTA
ncbi:TetR/AcrR family transcriptional regulator [Mesorhizobium abyssinicae]